MEGIPANDMRLQAALGGRGASELAALGRAGDGDNAEVVQAFGKIFAQQLIKEMRSTVDGGFFGSGAGSDIYESWFDEHVAEVLAADDALGLAGMMKAGLPQGEPVGEAYGGARILGLPPEEEESR